ncbi:MAG: T9SS type A sorting domain-containing protein [Bacteroidota bacterium]|nr:T9SS type A sorting domain-containing protein [Bacteroidota bacterium]
MKKKMILLLLVSVFSVCKSQTIYYDGIEDPGVLYYNEDSTLRETAIDLVGLFNKALNVNTFSIAPLTDTSITTGIFLKIDTNLLSTQRLQYCTAVSDGINKITFIASSSNGVRFGVYSYLAELGFKFYSPDSLWDIIPSLTTPYTLLSKVYKTPVEMHGWFGTGGFGVNAIDSTGSVMADKWSKFQRRNNMSNEYRGGGHIGEEWLSTNLSFLQANPCYVAEHNGQINFTPGIMPNVLNPAAKLHWANFAHTSFLSSYPERDPFMRGRISIEAADATLWGNTNSQNCNTSNWPSMSEQQFTLANYTTNYLKSQISFPFKTIAYAYAVHSDPPSFSLDTSILLGVAAGWQLETSVVGQLYRWHLVHQNLFEYDYLNIPDFNQQYPYASLKYLKNQANRINNWQTDGIQYESTYSIFAGAFLLQPFHKALMDGSNVENNQNTLVNDLFPGSKSKINELFNLWFNDNHFLASPFQYESKHRFPLYFSIINQADGLALGADEKKRIRMLKSYMHYLTLINDVKAFPADTCAQEDALVQTLCNYVVRIYKTGIINAHQQLNITLSQEATRSKLLDWVTYDTIGNPTWLNGPFNAQTPITDAEIDAEFISDTIKYAKHCNFKYVEPFDIIEEACKSNLIPKDTIRIHLFSYYDNGQLFSLYAPTAGNIQIKFKKDANSINKRLTFTIDSDDQLYTHTEYIDSITQSGTFSLSIPSSGTYQLLINSPSIETYADVSIISNGNFVYRSSAIYSGDMIDWYRDSLSAPRYIYVPKELDKLYFSVSNSHSDTLMAARYKFTNAQGNKPVLYVEPSDSNEYYFNVDTANAGKFWQLYVDSTVSNLFTLVNTQNVELYLQPGTCNLLSIKEYNKIDFQIFPNPSTGRFTINMKAEGNVNINVYNIIGQKSYSHQYPKWNGTDELDLSSLQPGIYLLRIENKGVFSTKKIVIAR